MPVKVRKILIARVYYPSHSQWPKGIDYIPEERSVVIWEGWGGPAQIGAYSSAGETWEWGPQKWFAEVGAEWFLPLLERIARDEEVTEEEILQAGEAATGRKLDIIIDEAIGARTPPALPPGYEEGAK